MTTDLNQKVYVAGHRGMVGSAIVRNLQEKGYTNIVTRTHKELDLTNQAAVQSFFEQEKPDQVCLAAAKVGGIHANNTFPAEFIYQNLMMEANVIHQAFVHDVKKLLFLGSSCIYPKLAPQPLKEEYLLTGPLEPTNEPYAVAKIAGIMGAKRTHELIPLCHPLALTHIDVAFSFDDAEGVVSITSTVKTKGLTGVEMEALTCVAVCALTVYDMCKAVDKGIELGPFFLLEKSGGKSGVYKRRET